MKLSMTYRVRTKGFNHIFDETVCLYRQAVSFFVDVCLTEWDLISTRKFQKERVNLMESLTVKTKRNPAVPYNFSEKFYKFPCYLRRAAIAEALGKVSSYRSNLANWEPYPCSRPGTEQRVYVQCHNSGERGPRKGISFPPERIRLPGACDQPYQARAAVMRPADSRPLETGERYQ